MAFPKSIAHLFNDTVHRPQIQVLPSKSLLDLPAELRQYIYDYYFLADGEKQIDPFSQ